MAVVSPDNEAIIKEFRANEGRCGGRFEGWPIALVHHKGAKSGVERVNPLVYQPRDGNFVIFASKGGAPVNPAWYYNLLANPNTTVEVGSETYSVNARVAVGEEREQIWNDQKIAYPNFAEYEAATTRTIPVIVLERA